MLSSSAAFFFQCGKSWRPFPDKVDRSAETRPFVLPLWDVEGKREEPVLLCGEATPGWLNGGPGRGCLAQLDCGP